MEAPQRDEAIDPDEQPVLDDIAEHGWSGIIIEKDEEGPGFEYTVGLMAAFDHPEVIVFGLSKETRHVMLWQIFRNLKEGRSFRAPGRYDFVLENYLCESRATDESQHPEYLGYAMWHHRRFGKLVPFQAVQCVWPDNSGRFPGESDCNEFVESSQPDLTLYRADRPSL